MPFLASTVNPVVGLLCWQAMQWLSSIMSGPMLQSVATTLYSEGYETLAHVQAIDGVDELEAIGITGGDAQAQRGGRALRPPG